MAAERWDVLVIGGGIVGAGIARDAAMRGMRVALVEKTDFAAGTSGKTSKLVHGGLRYLEDLRLGLVRSAIRERDLWLRNEPRLVRPLEFLIPVHRGGDARWKLRIALRLYGWFSAGRSMGTSRMVTRAELAALEPRLLPQDLKGAGRYFDASVPDARLVLETIRSAAEHGAVVANHAEVVGLLRDGPRVAGAKIRDAFAGGEISVHAKVVVNAAGPWLDRVRALAGNAPPTLRPTKGIHILVPRDLIGQRHAVALRAPDGRLFFMIPWGSFSLIGTTDSDYRQSLDDVRATDREVGYLLSAANGAFPKANLTASDVVSTYAGVRPLIASGSRAKESDISREHVVLEEDGMMGVAGGKLTTHRAMAEDVVDRVARRLAGGGARFGPCRTAEVPLRVPPNEDDARRVRELVAKPEILERLLAWYDPSDLAAHLTERPETAQVLAPDVPYLWAEVDHAVEHEMAGTLSDFMVRRTWILHEVRDHGRLVAPSVAARMAARLGWDRERIRAELAAFELEVERCVPARELLAGPPPEKA